MKSWYEEIVDRVLADWMRSLIGAIVVGILSGLLAGFLVGHDTGHSCERRAAIEAGVGRWEADRSSGESRFVYGCPEDAP